MTIHRSLPARPLPALRSSSHAKTATLTNQNHSKIKQRRGVVNVNKQFHFREPMKPPYDMISDYESI